MPVLHGTGLNVLVACAPSLSERQRPGWKRGKARIQELQEALLPARVGQEDPGAPGAIRGGG